MWWYLILFVSVLLIVAIAIVVYNYVASRRGGKCIINHATVASQEHDDFPPTNATILNASEYFTIEASATHCSAACGHGLGVFANRDISKDSFIVIEKRLLGKVNDAIVPLPLSNAQATVAINNNSLQEYTNLFQSSWNNYLRVSHHQRNCEVFVTRDGRVVIHTLRTILAREEVLRTMDYEWLLLWHRQELKRIYDAYREDKLDMKAVYKEISSMFNQSNVQLLLAYPQQERDSKKIALFDLLVQEYSLKYEQDVDSDDDFVQLFMMYIG